MNGKLLERCFVNLIDAMLKDGEVKYPSVTRFAEAAFPGGENPKKIWQAIRNGQNGKPRNVSISEAYGLALACGKNLDRLLVRAEVMIEQGWTLEQDVFNQAASSKPGRPRKTMSVAKTQESLPKVEDTSKKDAA